MYADNSQQIENEVLILYVLNKFDVSITEKSLTEIILSPGLINYFGFQTALTKLIEEKLINIYTDTDGVAMYSVTEDGQNILETLIPTVSVAVRSTYDAYLAKEKAKITMETNINAYTFIDGNKNQCVRCYIRENGNKIVDIRMPVPDKEIALQMCANWKTDAYSILMKLMNDMVE